MLIKAVDGRVVYDDITTSEKTMCDQIRGWEAKEEDFYEKKQVVVKFLEEARKEIATLKQRRAAKEGVQERFDCKIKDVGLRIKEVEARHASNLNDTRLDQMVKEKEKKMREEIKQKLQNQALLHHKILEGILDTEIFEKQLNVVFHREQRIQVRMRASKDELMFLVNRQDELKLLIRKKMAGLKERHRQVFEVEPKIKASFTRNTESAAKVVDFKGKVKVAEDEIKRLQTERLRMVSNMERLSVECNQKQKRAVKNAPMIEALKAIGPPQKAIDCYKVKNPDVIKAFEKFTQLYGNYNKSLTSC